MNTLLLGIPFDFMGMTYYRTTKDVSVGDIVIVQTPHGTFPGKVLKVRKPSQEEISKENFDTIFPEIIRIATFKDKDFTKRASIQADKISRETQKLAEQLKLNMKVLKSYLDIVEDKVLITFTSEARVDFRELVRLLSGTFRLKIELRQIGPRDQAKLVGGIGPCGLPLCCSVFLKQFDGISIAMAKNQLLSINIPKLSGQCGKLMCCLKFEDENYAKLRPQFPKIGEKFTYNNKNYEVTGLNILTGTITSYNGENYESFSKEEFERVKKGLSKVDESKLTKKDVNSGVDLSGHGLKDTAKRIAQIEKVEKRHREEANDRIAGPQKKNNSSNNNPNKAKNHNPSQKNNPSQNRNNNIKKENNSNRSFNNKSNHSFNNRKPSNHSFNNTQKKESGFIPVSQIADKSVLDVKPVNKNDKK